MSAGNEAAIKFSFEYGWCDLTLLGDGTSITVRASTLADSFRNFIKSFTHLTAGEPVSSAAWLGEGSGHYLDLTLKGANGFAIAVHEMGFDGYPTAPTWSPVRGRALFSTSNDFADFSVTLARELRRIQIHYADGSGYMKEWGWRFPADLFYEIEDHAARLGYRPGDH